MLATFLFMARYRRGEEPEEPALTVAERERLSELFARIHADHERAERGPTLRTAGGLPIEPQFVREIMNRLDR